MSGIAGLYFLDGRSVERAALERMAATISHRGPDRAGVWCGGPVGLGHRLLWTTPESLHEELPVEDTASELVLTADARIDNRDELIAALGLRERPPNQIPDSDLILAAYRQWGERCPNYLIGDFAFVIWDGRKRVLFCARDHFGIRPFYYYRSNRLFAFGSEIKALLCCPEIPRRLNERRVGMHLLMMVEDREITFYQNIFRLPPGHTLEVDEQGIQLQRYWSLDPTRELHLASDDEYDEAFRECFVEAVRCRLRSAYPVGTMLSGGLDSSAVTCVSQTLLADTEHRRLHTISATFDEKHQCDERRYIDLIVGRDHVDPHYVCMDETSPLADFERVLWHGDEPFTAPTLYIAWALCQKAHQQGIRILLDGVDGDTAVYHGDGYLAEMARRGHWETFVAEARAIAQHENLPPFALSLQRYGLPYFVELAKGGRWMRFMHEANELAAHIPISRRKLLRNYGFKPLIPMPFLSIWRRMRRRNQHLVEAGAHSIIHNTFLRRTGLDKQIALNARQPGKSLRTAREEHYGLLTSGLLTHVFELADKTAMAFSIESRHPYADRRLLELCLALPPEQKLHQGWIRFIQRRALAGILPEEIRWRGGKAVNAAAVTHALLQTDGPLLEEVVMQCECLEPYVDTAHLRKIYQRYQSHRDRTDEMIIWQAVILALWLQCSNVTA